MIVPETITSNETKEQNAKVTEKNWRESECSAKDHDATIQRHLNT